MIETQITEIHLWECECQIQANQLQVVLALGYTPLPVGHRGQQTLSNLY